MATKTTTREPRPGELTKERAAEIGKCYGSYIYFIQNYVKIYDSVESNWIHFSLWPKQVELLHQIHRNQLTVILKARQLGISWLALSYALWNVVFKPIASVGLFSRRDNEALYMLSNDRLRGMFNNLPLWMRADLKPATDSGHEWILTSGSAVRAFPTSAGDGYVNTLAVVDEADLAPDLNKLMRSVKPTIDNGGKLILLSRVDKSVPNSEFKQIYRGAKRGDNGWSFNFLPWSTHPGRDDAWYERQRRDVLSRTGSLDDLWEQYPATDTEALASRTLDKRIPPMWIEACYQEMKPVRPRTSPALFGLTIFHPAEVGMRYVIGADPAEGNPTSDDSSLTVVRVDNGEEVAVFSGKFEPDVFATYLTQIATYYNHAPALIERNNHGHAVIQWLDEHSRRIRLLPGHDAEPKKKHVRGKPRKRDKAGWLTNKLGKAILYTIAAEHFRTCANFDDEGGKSTIVLHDFTTYQQLMSIEGATLSAPEGDMDDRATSYALAQAGRDQLKVKSDGGGIIVDSVKGWGF